MTTTSHPRNPEHKMTPLPGSGAASSMFEGFEYRGVKLRRAIKDHTGNPDNRYATLDPVLPGNARPYRGIYLRATTKLGIMNAIDAALDNPAPLTEREQMMLTALELAQRMCNEALPKFNWGASALDANAIDLLNRTPGTIGAVIATAKLGQAS